jgi:hypothetical protein
MIATLTFLGFLKCLGYVFLGITAVGVVVGVFLFWSEIIWPKLSPKIPEKVKEIFLAVFAISLVLLVLGAIFIGMPLAVCTAPGGPCT